MACAGPGSGRRLPVSHATCGTDREVARTTVARLEAELAAAEEEQAAARTALERVQAEAAGAPLGMPAFASQLSNVTFIWWVPNL